MSKLDGFNKMIDVLPQVGLLAGFIRLTAADISANFSLSKILSHIKDFQKSKKPDSRSRELQDLFSQLFISHGNCNFVYKFGRYKISIYRSIDGKICLVKVLGYKEKPMLGKDILEIKKHITNYYFICDFDDFFVLKTLIDSQSDTDRDNFELDTDSKKEFIGFLNSIGSGLQFDNQYNRLCI